MIAWIVRHIIKHGRTVNVGDGRQLFYCDIHGPQVDAPRGYGEFGERYARLDCPHCVEDKVRASREKTLRAAA